jgi:molecular chaperone GrpE (heat shock protein)
MQKTDSKGAAATILVDFLDVRDKLLALKETHGEDDFGKQYNALGSAMKSAFDNMGVVEYELAPGDAVDLRRTRVVEKEASEYVAADTVLRQSAAGLELEGNVVRKAEVVASSGPAVEAEEAVVVKDEAAAKE